MFGSLLTKGNQKAPKRTTIVLTGSVCLAIEMARRALSAFLAETRSRQMPRGFTFIQVDIASEIVGSGLPRYQDCDYLGIYKGKAKRHIYIEALVNTGSKTFSRISRIKFDCFIFDNEKSWKADFVVIEVLGGDFFSILFEQIAHKPVTFRFINGKSRDFFGDVPIERVREDE